MLHGVFILQEDETTVKIKATKKYRIFLSNSVAFR